MKYTLCITQQCNLACQYCYVGKRQARMSLEVAEKVIDFAFTNTPLDEMIDIGFFGGEPLLEFDLIRAITDMVENHPCYGSDRVELAIATNGTIFSDEIADFVKAHNISFGISCDGPPFVQDTFRRFPDGQASSQVVETTIKRAIDVFSTVLVNSVYHPRTFRYLPQVVEYFSSLGLRQIYLNPDFSAPWSKDEMELLPMVYDQVAQRYIDYYIQEDPHFVSLIDGKIAVILRGGYRPLERCRMGKGEFAFTPEGNVYPCERLVEDGLANNHCIGHINEGLNTDGMLCHRVPDQTVNDECLSCGLKDYCMNWCGCSNYMSTGYYNRVSPFLCLSEKAAIQSAFNVFRTLEGKLGPTFFEHLAGSPAMRSIERKCRV